MPMDEDGDPVDGGCGIDGSVDQRQAASPEAPTNPPMRTPDASSGDAALCTSGSGIRKVRSMLDLGSVMYPDIGHAGRVAVEGGFRKQFVARQKQRERTSEPGGSTDALPPAPSLSAPKGEHGASVPLSRSLESQPNSWCLPRQQKTHDGLLQGVAAATNDRTWRTTRRHTSSSGSGRSKTLDESRIGARIGRVLLDRASEAALCKLFPREWEARRAVVADAVVLAESGKRSSAPGAPAIPPTEPLLPIPCSPPLAPSCASKLCTSRPAAKSLLPPQFLMRTLPQQPCPYPNPTLKP